MFNYNNYNDNKIHLWHGGECPVHAKTEVRVWLRNGGPSDTREAGRWYWKHHDGNADIIAFQVTKQHFDIPEEVWIGISNSDIHHYFATKEAAEYESQTYAKIVGPYRLVTSD